MPSNSLTAHLATATASVAATILLQKIFASDTFLAVWNKLVDRSTPEAEEAELCTSPTHKGSRRKGSARGFVAPLKDRKPPRPETRSQSAAGHVFDDLAGDDNLLEFHELHDKLVYEYGYDLAESEIERIWTRAFGKDSLSRALDFFEFYDGVENVPFLKLIIAQLETVESPFATPEGYDYTKSTNDNYRAPPGDRTFFGEYQDIRATLDYSYHVNYTEQRQLWQDRAVNSVVVRTDPQTNPWIVYTCGPMGGGKGFALSWMSRHGFFPLEEIVHIDPDHFKKIMPEWSGYVKEGKASGNSDLAGNSCHRETGFIQEIAQEVAMRKSQNVWVDGSLKDGDWFKGVFIDIRQKFPQYQIAIFEVHTSEEIVRQRVKERFEKTGRNVPEAALVASLLSVSDSIHKLTPLCDFVAKIDNNGSQPELIAYSVVDSSKDWGLIADQFAKPPLSHFPASMAPLALVELGPLSDVVKYDAGYSPSHSALRRARTLALPPSPCSPRGRPANCAPQCGRVGRTARRV